MLRAVATVLLGEAAAVTGSRCRRARGEINGAFGPACVRLDTGGERPRSGRGSDRGVRRMRRLPSVPDQAMAIRAIAHRMIRSSVITLIDHRG
ncbi:hypothetical protein GCM10010129_54140 [Streptomyces fumigatiscleroticus]|nr:hypothetical protein GCM10010129_54140 [Streptomyces fumigatiscleroticus]